MKDEDQKTAPGRGVDKLGGLGERRAAELDELYQRARQSKSYWADEDETAAWARLRAQEERERRKKMN